MQKDAVVLVARLLMAAIFIFSGFGKIGGFEGTAGYIGAKGLPLPALLTIGAIAVELGGGVLLAIGWKARWAALALAVFTLVAGFIFHNFWAVPPEQLLNQRTNFFKNIAMVGGLLVFWVHGAGTLSVDKR
jgi:putative oxidoreductase